MTLVTEHTEFSDRLRAEIRKRAKREPNKVYVSPFIANGSNRCVYTNPTNGCGSCIVGRALLAAGVPQPLVKKGDEKMEIGFVMTSDNLIKSLPSEFEVDEATSMWIRAVQMDQDAGETWGQAVIDADKYYKSIARRDGIELAK